MNKLPKEIIIIGGGASITEGINLGLKDRIKDKFVIGLNYAFRYFDCSCICFVDKHFYLGKLTADDNAPTVFRNELEVLPLLIGTNKQKKFPPILPNTVLLPSSEAYHSTKSRQEGFYYTFLTGIFALNVAQYLIDYQGIIYLLGYDFPRRTHAQLVDNKRLDTHFYSDKEINHVGQHRTNWYEGHDPDRFFGVFKEPDVKIYNVSLNSNISCFEKISYEDMFGRLNNDKFNQPELRAAIQRKLL